jgi:hypothetical protein
LDGSEMLWPDELRLRFTESDLGIGVPFISCGVGRPDVDFSILHGMRQPSATAETSPPALTEKYVKNHSLI